MEELAQNEKAPFAQHAAGFSCLACILVLLIITLTGRVHVLAALFALVGVLAGIVALFGIPKHGLKKILLYAVIGIILNGLVILFFVTDVITYINYINKAIELDPKYADDYYNRGLPMMKKASMIRLSRITPRP